MKLLFISHWGFRDPLTTATVLPHLKILTESGKFEQIILCTIEREEFEDDNYGLPNGVKHIAIHSGKSLRNKLVEIFKVPGLIRQLCTQKGIDLVICRGAVAGTIGYLTLRSTNIPLYIESYEPHAEYMVQSKVWKRWSPQYVLQKHWQTRQLITASGVMTVSTAYTNRLIEDGINVRKIKSVPCAVDVAAYRFDPYKRAKIRGKMGFSKEDLIAIYVGKFGGLYYDLEAFKLFSSISDLHPHFRLIVLSPNNHDEIRNKLRNAGIDSKYCIIDSVPPSDVAVYLSASDFGICTHRSHEYSMGFSPVKNGEYWANGLPILISHGIGDDSETVIKENAGALFSISDPKSIKVGIQAIMNIIKDPQSRDRISLVAQKYRSSKSVHDAYNYFFFNR